jgi:hypothetical protein
VQIDQIHELGLCAKNVFYKGKRIAGIASIGHDDGEQDLILLESHPG